MPPTPSGGGRMTLAGVATAPRALADTRGAAMAKTIVGALAPLVAELRLGAVDVRAPDEELVAVLDYGLGETESGGAADGVNHGKILRQEVIADNGGARSAMGACQDFGGILQISRAHVRRWGVDQVARESLAGREDFDAIGIKAFRGEQAGGAARLCAVTVEGVAREQAA